MRLYHHINGTEYADKEIIAAVLAEGLQIEQTEWQDIAQVLPNRPRGIFFWDEKGYNPHLTRDLVSVDVADLDTENLWAFPAEIADYGNLMAAGIELPEGVVEQVQSFQPVPFKQFEGQWPAEYIYTDDVPGNIIKKE